MPLRLVRRAMTDEIYSKDLQRALDALPPVAGVVATAEFRWCRDEGEKLEVISIAYILTADGFDEASAARWFWSKRKRERKDGRRAGCALNVMALSLAAAGMDPCDLLLAEEAAIAYRAVAIAAGWATPAAPATVGHEPALPVAMVARGCLRGLRTVQTKMRGICWAEIAGQGVLPGIPAALEVYAGRVLGGAR